MLKSTAKLNPGRKLTLYVKDRDVVYLDALQAYLGPKNISLSSLVSAVIERLVEERKPGKDNLERILETLDLEL